MAQGQLRVGQRSREPVCRAAADRGRHLPAASAWAAGLPGGGGRSGAPRHRSALAAPSRPGGCTPAMDRQLPKPLLRMVDTLEEAQLQALYNLVAQRLQLAEKVHALAALSPFQVLDRVSFLHLGKRLQGTVTRLNQK